VTNLRLQREIDAAHTVRERLLAMLAAFFAVVGLLLAAVGIYGVLHYSVLQRQKELGVRLALGARALDIAAHVTREMSLMVGFGVVAGIALGFVTARFIVLLLYDIKATDPAMTAVPLLIIVGTAVAAALPAVVRATRIDPASMLRDE
jgi:ABC-type antimicrobial peptide transport system permease subunit